MKTTTSSTDKDSLYSYIERANSSRPRSKASKTKIILACVGIVSVLVLYALSVWTGEGRTCCVVASLVAFFALAFFVGSKWLYFLKSEELSLGVNCLCVADWAYMEMWIDDWKNYLVVFRRIMRSPAFILVAGFYYKLKVGDEVVVAKLIALARERDSDLNAVEMSSNRGLRPRDARMLTEKFRSDLGVTWIYKLKQRKVLWAMGCILLFLLVMIRHFMVLVDAVRLLIKGYAE